MTYNMYQTYPYPYQQQYPMQQQVQQSQIQNSGFVSARSIEEAYNWPVAPGNSVTFKIENAPYVCTKTKGVSPFDQPVFEKYNTIHFKAAREKYRNEYGPEMDKALRAKEVLKKLDVSRPINRDSLQDESTVLKEKLNSLSADLNSMKQKMASLQNLRNCIRKVMPEALPTKRPDGKESVREMTETAVNQKNLDLLAARVTDQVIRQSEVKEIRTIREQKEKAQDVNEHAEKR